MLTARAECYLYRVPGAFAESVARSNLYREAGADCLYTPGVRDRGEVAALVREIDGPMNFVVGKGTADYTLEELGELGIRRVSIGGSLLRATLALAERAAAEMKSQGRFTWGRGSARRGGFRSALRESPRRMRHEAKTLALEPAIVDHAG